MKGVDAGLEISDEVYFVEFAVGFVDGGNVCFDVLVAYPYVGFCGGVFDGGCFYLFEADEFGVV